jgi:hypothetical protein
LKETEINELLAKKKLAKSRKKKMELFRECKDRLYSLVSDWKGTPGKDEEKLYVVLKESVKKERINKKKENELSRVSTSDDNKVSSIVMKRRQLLEDDMGDSTHMMTKPLLLLKENDSSIFISSWSTSASSGSIASQNADSSSSKVSGQQVTEKTTLETTTRIACVSADQVAPSVANATKRLLAGQNSLKKALNVTPTKVSGQLAKILLTKPQHVYTSVGVGDQVKPGLSRQGSLSSQHFYSVAFKL